MDQNKTQFSPYPPYFGSYQPNPNNIKGYKPSFPNQQCSPSGLPILPVKQKSELSYWELLSPALFGTAGAFFLSLFAGENKDNLNNKSGGTLLKFALIGYSIGALISVYFAINKAIINSRPSYHDLFFPIAGALFSVILFFGAEYLLLYRCIPSSFTGDVGDDIWTQILSFLYFSVTTMATGNLGDIMPGNLTARLLIASEIAFYLFTAATAIPLLLVQQD